MKKFFIAFALAVAGSLFGEEIKAQKASNICHFHVTTFKFKKPRTDCMRSFGLCIKTRWHTEFNDPTSTSCEFALVFGNDEPRVDKNEIYAGVAVSKSKLWLVLPKEIKELEDYRDEDISFLPIEEKIVLYVNKKAYKMIQPQKAPMREEGRYLIYELELTD